MGEKNIQYRIKFYATALYSNLLISMYFFKRIMKFGVVLINSSSDEDKRLCSIKHFLFYYCQLTRFYSLKSLIFKQFVQLPCIIPENILLIDWIVLELNHLRSKGISKFVYFFSGYKIYLDTYRVDFLPKRFVSHYKIRSATGKPINQRGNSRESQ